MECSGFTLPAATTVWALEIQTVPAGVASEKLLLAAIMLLVAIGIGVVLFRRQAQEASSMPRPTAGVGWHQRAETTPMASPQNFEPTEPRRPSVPIEVPSKGTIKIGNEEQKKKLHVSGMPSGARSETSKVNEDSIRKAIARSFSTPAPGDDRPATKPAVAVPTDPLLADTVNITVNQIDQLLVEGTVMSEEFRPCACDLQRSASGWKRHQGASGKTARVLHLEAKGASKAVKIYSPYDLNLVYHNPQTLREIAQKIQELGAAGEHFLMPSEFREYGFEILYSKVQGEKHSKLHKFHILMMPWVECDQYQLDCYVDDCLSKPNPTEKLVEVARALRLTFSKLAKYELAHGDLCAANIFMAETGGADGLRAILIDTDTLTWKGHDQLVQRFLGHDGYYTRGREVDPPKYARACINAGRISLIDAPAAIVLYLSVIGLAHLPNRTTAGVDQTILFDKSDLASSRALREECRRFLPHLDEVGVPLVGRLISELGKHCDSELGVDITSNSPFGDPQFCQALDTFEKRIGRARAAYGGN